MSSTTAVNSSAAQQTQTSTNALTSTKTIGQSDFLNLLVAQLKNQDPMNPVDNAQFVNQLATFSSLEQLISINSNVTKLATDSSTTNVQTE
jgi:flagellar basal-body rod modification protein FlgD